MTGGLVRLEAAGAVGASEQFASPNRFKAGRFKDPRSQAGQRISIERAEFKESSASAANDAHQPILYLSSWDRAEAVLRSGRTRGWTA